MKIKRLTIVTAQGFQTYLSNENTRIEDAYYRVAGDPYECFRVIKKGEIISEIRCVHNLEIEYQGD